MGEKNLQTGRTEAVERVITEESLIQAIQDASLDSIRDDNPHGAVSRKDICRVLGKGDKWVLNRLHVLVYAGEVGVTKISDKNISGDRTVIAAYYNIVKDSPET